MQIKDFFERVYVVNLPDRKDRYRQIVQELEKAGMPLSPNKIEIFPAIRPSDAINFPSVGALGCFLSHLSILKQAKKDGLANVLILEDDLVISERFRTEQAVIVEQLRSVDWGFVYFGHGEDVEKASLVELYPFSAPIIMTQSGQALQTIFLITTMLHRALHLMWTAG